MLFGVAELNHNTLTYGVYTPSGVLAKCSTL
jgi:hypothetical protein